MEKVIKPCSHMSAALNRMARGEKHGLWLAYARQHLKGCPRCQQAFDAIVSLLSLVQEARTAPEPETLDGHRWEAIEQTIRRAETPPE